MEEIVLCHLFAQEYGWTPEELERAPKKLVQGLLVLQQVYAAKQQSAREDQEKFARYNQDRNVALRARHGNISHGR